MPRVHVEVRGRVQGVGFRWFVRECAARLGLAGWVRNRPDGAVEVAAEGESTALDALMDALREGPPGSHVHDVRTVSDPLTESLDTPFTIRR